jgi:glycosyltransferase involved in cell wall biosynthesis
LGRVTIESQAMGVPVAAYDIGGVREGFRHGVTGFLLPLGDVAGLAAALARIATGAVDGRAMGRAGRAFVEEAFGFPVLARRHEEFTLAVAGRRPAGRELVG